MARSLDKRQAAADSPLATKRHDFLALRKADLDLNCSLLGSVSAMAC